MANGNGSGTTTMADIPPRTQAYVGKKQTPTVKHPPVPVRGAGMVRPPKIEKLADPTMKDKG